MSHILILLVSSIFVTVFTVFICICHTIDYAPVWFLNRTFTFNVAEYGTPQPIDVQVYDKMDMYARLIDISYCIDSYHQIEEPFECDLCGPLSHNMSLVCQWYFDDAVCGFIGKTSIDIFDQGTKTEFSGEKKTVVVSLRGTRSIHDTIADLKVDMVRYDNIGHSLPKCGEKCRVHNGFWDYYKNTLDVIEGHIREEIDTTDSSSEIIFVGHSLGGSVALLLALHFLDLGYVNLSLVTMGQPLVGNKDFTEWADHVLGSSLPLISGTSGRKYMRVIHKGDLVTTVPRNGGFFEHYYPFENQIYINASADVDVPLPEQVVDCYSGKNPDCISGDFVAPFRGLNDFYRSHNTYFRNLGLCGIHI